MDLVGSEIEVVTYFMTFDIDYFIDDVFDAWIVEEIEAKGCCYDWVIIGLPVFIVFFLSQVISYAAWQSPTQRV